MEVTADDLGRGTVRGAARDAARQARVAADREVRRLIADVEGQADSNCVGDWMWRVARGPAQP